MHQLLRVALAYSLLFLFGPLNPVNAEDIAIKSLSKRIQKALNKQDISTFMSLLPEKKATDLVRRYRKFSNRFPNAKWTVRQSRPLKDGRLIMEIVITGKQSSGIHKYSLEAKQRLGLKILDKAIIDQQLISEHTIIQNSKRPLSISLGIPDVVLTGTRYNVDVIFNKPLEGSIIAGGLISLTPEQIKRQESPSIELVPMGGGGLFKSVQAPLKPGVQNWAALLAHPEGLVSVTKMVRIVSDKSDIHRSIDSLNNNNTQLD